MPFVFKRMSEFNVRPESPAFLKFKREIIVSDDGINQPDSPYF